MMCFNPAKSFQLGWYDDRTKVIDPAIDLPFHATMIGVSDYANSDPSNYVVVKILGSYDSDIYIGYNRKSGINSGTGEGGNKIMVVTRSSTGYSNSILMAKLDSSNYYSISDFYSGSDLIIRFTERPANFDGAVIDVFLAASGVCAADESLFEVILTTDNYGSETSWTLIDGEKTVASGNGYSSNQNYVHKSCILSGKSYTFVIEDSWGDGICCSYGSGSYSVKVEGNVIFQGASFGSRETKTFNVPPGQGNNPTLSPTPNPTRNPTAPPTKQPTPNPTASPTKVPTKHPTPNPTIVNPAPTTLPISTLLIKDEFENNDWGGFSRGGGRFIRLSNSVPTVTGNGAMEIKMKRASRPPFLYVVLEDIGQYQELEIFFHYYPENVQTNGGIMIDYSIDGRLWEPSRFWILGSGTNTTMAKYVTPGQYYRIATCTIPVDTLTDSTIHIRWNVFGHNNLVMYLDSVRIYGWY